jgi:hypothetical protein
MLELDEHLDGVADAQLPGALPVNPFVAFRGHAHQQFHRIFA